MYLFFCDTINYETGIIEFDPIESKHILRTLRLKKGDLAWVTDGNNTRFTCKIIQEAAPVCVMQIVAKEENVNTRRYSVHIASALTKNPARMEFFIEKAVELGLDAFTPIVFERSERLVYKQERFKRLSISALKQAQTCFLPQINDVTPFCEFLRTIKENQSQKFIAYQDDKAKHLMNEIQRGTDVIILIGPEGDFTHAEIEMAKKGGFEIIQMGTQRLRTETAALAACMAVNFKNQIV